MPIKKFFGFTLTPYDKGLTLFNDYHEVDKLFFYLKAETEPASGVHKFADFYPGNREKKIYSLWYCYVLPKKKLDHRLYYSIMLWKFTEIVSVIKDYKK